MMSSHSSEPAALIFDMDGVLVHSNPFHLQKWAALLKKHGIPFNDADLPGIIVGVRDDTNLRRFFGNHITDEEVDRLNDQLEEKFREVFTRSAGPPPGAQRLLEEGLARGLPMALASSGTQQNVDFVVDALKLRPYLRVIISGNDVTHPKPDPEIYLKAADKLGIEPVSCVAFEDSFVGVEAAKRAGMKCVAIASTFPGEELRARTHADLVVPGFEVLSLSNLQQLFDGTVPNAGKSV